MRRSGFSFPWRSLLFLVVVGAVLRYAFCAVLRVPTPSMEPTIHGDPVRGDELLVFTPWFKLMSPDRFDLACFERAEDDSPSRLNVKRIVGLPGESIRIADGDLYVTPAAGGVERMVEKSYDDFRPLLVKRFVEHFGADFDPHFNYDSSQIVPDRGGVVVNGESSRPDRPTLALEPTAVTFDNGWVDDAGVDHPGSEGIKDVLFDLEVTPLKETTCVEFGVTIGVCDIQFQIVPWSSGHAIEININRDGHIDQHQQPIRSLLPNKKHRLEFFHIDGNLGVAVDGSCETTVDLPITGAKLGAGAQGISSPAFWVWAGSIRLTRFEIWRDLHYSDPIDASFAGHASSCRIPEDSVFVLGDNSGQSTDSRYYGPVPLKNLRGFPFFILSPTRRVGFLH